MKNEQETIFTPYYDSFVAGRVEQLTAEAEKLPAYIEGRASIQDIIAKASLILGNEELDTLISAIRGTDIAIYEHIYYSGLKDGIWISGQIEGIKKRNE